jgi:hypothetical protein
VTSIQAATSGLPRELSGENVAFAQGSGRGASMGLFVLGLAGLIITAAVGFTGAGGMLPKHAVASYHVGVMSVLAVCLGATFFTMVFHLTNAGWTSTLRRQFENVMAFLPFAWLMMVVLLVIEIAGDGFSFAWLTDANAGDQILHAKGPFYFWPGKVAAGAIPVFFIGRTLFYGAFWFFLTNRLRGLSLRQDETGDRALSARARFTCAWAMPIFALSIAFCAFDYLMSVDFKFFSTMWGVYYFAGAAFSSSAVVTFILARIVSAGKCKGAVTSEHFHDMGKLMFTFTVFWAYIAFSQYFLYWYANIPEETAFFLHRSGPGWRALGAFLMLGHFALPFVYLVSRVIKKSLPLVSLACAWFVIVHVADIYWIVRPMTYAGLTDHAEPGLRGVWLDLAGIAGVWAIFAGFVLRKVTGGSLVAVRDPFIGEGLTHRNYV